MLQPGDLQPPFDTIAWYLPIWGLLLAVVTAAVLPGRLRRLWLAIGPFLGVWAMARLRAHPDAANSAGGRR